MRNNLAKYQARLKRLNPNAVVLAMMRIRGAFPGATETMLNRYEFRLRRLTKRALLASADMEINRETRSDIPTVRIAALAAKDAIR